MSVVLYRLAGIGLACALTTPAGAQLLPHKDLSANMAVTMAVCAIVTAMLADRSLWGRSCAPAGVVKAQARPIPARRYSTTDMIESSRAIEDAPFGRRV